jgi:hypothetical protein
MNEFRVKMTTDVQYRDRVFARVHSSMTILGVASIGAMAFILFSQ